MAKKNPHHINEKYDSNIIEALLKIDCPIIGVEGIEFYVRDEARKERGIEHIAKKEHRLKVRDIESLPSILRKPKYIIVDPHNRNYKNYYGIRKGDDPNALLKIVTWPDEHNPKKELIITIFPTKSIKVD